MIEFFKTCYLWLKSLPFWLKWAVFCLITIAIIIVTFEDALLGGVIGVILTIVPLGLQYLLPQKGDSKESLHIFAEGVELLEKNTPGNAGLSILGRLVELDEEYYHEVLKVLVGHLRLHHRRSGKGRGKAPPPDKERLQDTLELLGQLRHRHAASRKKERPGLINLSELDLREGVFKDSWHNANLAGADLTGADCSSAHLAQANLTGAKLASADMRQANLTGANFEGVDLTGAHLDGTIMDASIIGAPKSIKGSKGVKKEALPAHWQKLEI